MIRLDAKLAPSFTVGAQATLVPSPSARATPRAAGAQGCRCAASRAPRRAACSALMAAAALLLGCSTAHAATCRVAASGASGNDGSSWALATTLPSALAAPACSEIWVAEGAYKPTTGTDRTATFAIRSGVAVYGGFGGSENTRDERDPATHRSVLSGDIGGDDVVDAHGATASADDIVGGNSYHVVRLGAATPATLLDGFTLSGGLADGSGNDSELSAGGGLSCIGDGAGQECSPALRNLVFRGNFATSGGGMVCIGRNEGVCGATLENVAFVGNFATGGAAMLNGAVDGGIARAGVRNATFSGNTSEQIPGAFANMANNGGSAEATLTNVTFNGNSGAVLNLGVSATANVTLVNVVAWGDSQGELFVQGGTLSVSHGIVQGGCAAGVTCTDMVAGNPQLGVLQDGGVTPVLLPGVDSVARDAGTCDEAPATDQRGVVRPQGTACDIGAVEVRQAHLAVEVGGAGKVDAIAAPLPLGTAIAGCRQGDGDCSAWYRIEPDAPTVLLILHPDAGSAVQSASGCGGSLAGNTFTTAALDGDCTVQVAFAPATHTIGGTVTGLAGGGLVLALNGSESLPIAADGGFSFDTTIAAGNPYDVTIAAQPSQPSQHCIVVNGNGSVGDNDVTNVVIHCGAALTYTVGGTVAGLAPGASITLSINAGGMLTLAANGAYVFAPRFAPGDSYVVAVAAQPAGQHCTLDHATGTIGSADVTDVEVACSAGGAHLQLVVTDDGDYARYGQVRDYFVTLANTGNDSAHDVAVGAELDPAFDVPNVQWACVGGAPGTACTAQGAGGFADTATLPPATQLVWIVRVPIRGDSDAATATFLAHAGGASDAGDTDTLVVFRDGFDVPYADGAGVVDPARREEVLESADAAALEASPDAPQASRQPASQDHAAGAWRSNASD